jgi:hypothetical protein
MSFAGQSWEHAYTERYPPDTTAAIFWLKNRRPDLWRDRHETVHSAGEGVAAVLAAAWARKPDDAA